MSMQTTDPIADLLTRIRNAKMDGKTEVLKDQRINLDGELS